MSESKYTEPIVPPIQSSPDLTEYNCPHCQKFLFKGNVKKINMVCHHCQKMINVDSHELKKPIELTKQGPGLSNIPNKK